MLQKLLVLAGLALVAVNAGEMLPQCQCKDMEDCKDEYIDSVVPCADHCQKHAAAVGANYPKLRECIMAKEPKIKQALKCIEANNKDSCAQGPGKEVPKRYPETLKIAAVSEINKMLDRSGVDTKEVKGLVGQGKKYYSCMKTCMDKKAGQCADKLGCGLDLPSDTVLVQQGKKCAVSAGFDNEQIRELCKCAVDAGVTQLGDVCAKLTIT